VAQADVLQRARERIPIALLLVDALGFFQGDERLAILTGEIQTQSQRPQGSAEQFLVLHVFAQAHGLARGAQGGLHIRPLLLGGIVDDAPDAGRYITYGC